MALSAVGIENMCSYMLAAQRTGTGSDICVVDLSGAQLGRTLEVQHSVSTGDASMGRRSAWHHCRHHLWCVVQGRCRAVHPVARHHIRASKRGVCLGERV